MIEKICKKITNYLSGKIEMSEERTEVINFGLLVLLDFLHAMGYPSLFDKVLTDAFYFVIQFWLKIFF